MRCVSGQEALGTWNLCFVVGAFSDHGRDVDSFFGLSQAPTLWYAHTFVLSALFYLTYKVGAILFYK